MRKAKRIIKHILNKYFSRGIRVQICIDDNGFDYHSGSFMWKHKMFPRLGDYMFMDDLKELGIEYMESGLEHIDSLQCFVYVESSFSICEKTKKPCMKLWFSTNIPE